MNMTVRTNYFRQWRDAGYLDLVPVIPPDAKVSERSHLKNSLGKAPGIRYASGLWGPFQGWDSVKADVEQLDAWSAMGASVGLRRGTAFLLDIDAYDETTAAAIEADAIAQLGPAPLRIGQWPKRALLYRADGEIKGRKVTFETNNRAGQIELPAQVVVHGIHASSGKPYQWPRGLMKFEDLTPVSPEKLNAFMDAQRRKLPNARTESTSTTDREKINQSSLAGDTELVAQAILSLPNSREAFPTYDSMILVGNAIKAALVHEPALANELWHTWCEKWEGGDYNEDLTEARWRTLKPPHSVGANYIYDKADALAPREDGRSYAAIAMLGMPEAQEVPENPYAELARAEQSKQATDIYLLLTIDEIIDRPPPKWLVARHIPEKSVGFLYSEPGVGKSFLALDMGLSIAHGLPQWHGDAIETDPAASVIYIASEGSYGFRNRIKAWRSRRGITHKTNRFLLLEQTINFMKEDDVAKLLRTLSSVKGRGSNPCIVFVDTVSRALPGADENLQKDMTLFVRACDAVKEAFGCAVVGVHHSSKQGGMRGSTVLLGAGDFVFSLSRKKGATIGVLDCEKQKDGPDGWEESYRFDTVSLGDNETSLVVERMEGGAGANTVLTPETTASILKAMGDAWEAGEPWSKVPRCKPEGRYAVRRMVSDFGFEGAVAEETLALWEASGLISVALRDGKSKLKGYQVGAGAGQAVHSEGIFD
ncbi:putative helicase/primease protein [Rhizobium phage RHph_N65]|nr:putative helicase/primease protein [Rhizobium phage RHph_N65]